MACDRKVSLRILENFWRGCGHCHGERGASCPFDDVADSPNTDAGRERRFGVPMSAVLVFLLPLLTTIGGAYLLGHTLVLDSPQALSRSEVVGGSGGLLAGILLAKLIATVVSRRKPLSSTRSTRGHS
jgi:hypothetical protein